MRVTRGQVLALVSKWKPRLLLESWTFTVQLTRKLGVCQGEFDAMPEYLDACLRLHPDPAILPPEDVEAVIVHELLHAHTGEMWEMLEDLTRGDPVLAERARRAHERLTSTLQRIVMR